MAAGSNWLSVGGGPSVAVTVPELVETPLSNGVVVTCGRMVLPAGEKVRPHGIYQLTLADGRGGHAHVIVVVGQEVTFCGQFS
jgi:hypothetical protein